MIAPPPATAARGSPPPMTLPKVNRSGTHPSAAWGDAACRRFLRHLQEDSLPLAQWGAFRRADNLGKGLDAERQEEAHQALLARLEALAAAAPPLSVRALALDGAALMRLTGRPGGPWLGELQRQLLEAVLDDPEANTPEQLAILTRDLLAGDQNPSE